MEQPPAKIASIMYEFLVLLKAFNKNKSIADFCVSVLSNYNSMSVLNVELIDFKVTIYDWTSSC